MRTYRNQKPIESIKEALALLTPKIEEHNCQMLLCIDGKESFIEIEVYCNGGGYSHSNFYCLCPHVADTLRGTGWVEPARTGWVKLVPNWPSHRFRISNEGKDAHARLSLEKSLWEYALRNAFKGKLEEVGFEPDSAKKIAEDAFPPK